MIGQIYPQRGKAKEAILRKICWPTPAVPNFIHKVHTHPSVHMCALQRYRIKQGIGYHKRLQNRFKTTSKSRGGQLTKSHILMTLSLDPVTNHWLPGSTAMLRTHPIWPLITRYSFQGGLHCGLGIVGAFLGTMAPDCLPPLGIATSA